MTPLTPNPRQIMVAMSGGVDSSVTAAMLQQRGYQVVGVYMRLSRADDQAQQERARRIAQRLGLPLEVVDLADAFQRQVLDSFSHAYQAGLTPNPCWLCNRTIKFGLLRAFGRDHLGIAAMATGHYARTLPGPDGRVRLMTGLDPNKDQSYFLSGLGQEHLSGVTFPLGETTKEKVYQVAAALGLSGLHSAESQDICFLQGRDLASFFSDLPPRPGEFVTRAGECRGDHQGIFRYTVGQRRGIGIPDATPYYVIGLDAQRNRVVIGKEEDLWQDRLAVREMHWLAGSEPVLPHEFMVKIRYRHGAAPARVSRDDRGGYTIRFSDPQRAITPGQIAALYLGDEVIGSGAIDL